MSKQVGGGDFDFKCDCCGNGSQGEFTNKKVLVKVKLLNPDTGKFDTPEFLTGVYDGFGRVRASDEISIYPLQFSDLFSAWISSGKDILSSPVAFAIYCHNCIDERPSSCKELINVRGPYKKMKDIKGQMLDITGLIKDEGEKGELADLIGLIKSGKNAQVTTSPPKLPKPRLVDVPYSPSFRKIREAAKLATETKEAGTGAGATRRGGRRSGHRGKKRKTRRGKK